MLYIIELMIDCFEAAGVALLNLFGVNCKHSKDNVNYNRRNRKRRRRYRR